MKDWISEENLEPLLTAMSWFVDYEFCYDEIEIILLGIRKTDAEEDNWYDYSFYGKEKIDMKFAKDEPGSGIVFFDIQAPEKIEYKIEAIVQFMDNYILRDFDSSK